MTKLVYLQKDDKEVINSLKKVRHPDGIYYKRGRVIGYSWILNVVTIDKMIKEGKISDKNII